MQESKFTRAKAIDKEIEKYIIQVNKLKTCIIKYEELIDKNINIPYIKIKNESGYYIEIIPLDNRSVFEFLERQVYYYEKEIAKLEQEFKHL